LVILDKPSQPVTRYALAEPLAVAVNAAMHVRTQAFGPVLIIGDGTIGVLTAWVLNHLHQQDVILLGRRQHRLNQAKRLGINASTDATTLPASIARIVVASGSQTGFDLGLKLLEKAGQLIFLGYLNENDNGMSPEQLNAVVRCGVSIQGCFGYSRAVFREAVGLLESDSFDEDCVIDRIVRLDELPPTMQMLVERKVEGLKILVAPAS
jgi:threonine dehydrogenase-like Zn-dependent dehydrogenase